MSACPDLLAGPPSVPRARGSALILAALSLASLNATAAAQQAVPWAVEAPGAAGSRFGLGLDVFFERQESLRITDIEEEGGSRQGDPGLLNRKFDYRFDLAGVGLQLPVALPRLGLAYPTLVFQAATADVTFDFLDRTREGDSVTYEGRGPLFGAGLELTGALCRSCPWFAGASYRFQKLPSLDVDRSPSFGPPGFEVLRDETRLSRDVHEASTRIGYGFPGGRTVSYLGARYRSTKLEIEDELSYRDPFQEVTALDSQTRLESETTLALAGIEARLGPRIFSRMETSIGDKDWGILFKVVYLPTKEPERLTDDQSAEIAAQIERSRTEYVQAVNALPEVVELAVFNALLDRTEEKLLALLPFPDFAALRDSVQYEFQKVRYFRLFNTKPFMSRFMPVEPAAVRIAPESLSKAEVSPSLNSIRDFISKVWGFFEDNDIDIDLCVTTEPPRATVVLWPASYRQGYKGPIKTNRKIPLRRGRYAYEVKLRGYTQINCSKDSALDPDLCLLDLLSHDVPLVECTLRKPNEGSEEPCIVDNEINAQVRCTDP